MIGEILQSHRERYGSEKGSVTMIGTVILSAPRPDSMLLHTCESLASAGFEKCIIYYAAKPTGHWSDYKAALQASLNAWPDADWHFVAEDDVIACAELCLYLKRTLAKLPAEKIALCSPYCPEAYIKKARGWQPEWRAPNQSYLAGSQAWIFPRDFAEDLVAKALAPAGWGGDRVVGSHAGKRGRVCLYHHPSLIQHEGEESSVIYSAHRSTIRHAADFIGEGASPWQYMEGSWTGEKWEVNPY